MENVLSYNNYIEEVAAYIRVSTQEQKLHGISLDAQVQKLQEYADKNNMKIVEWYKDEGVSGRKLIKNRPELQRMIHDAQKGKFKRIIFIKLDRFFRSVAEYHECMKLIEPVIWTATEEKYDLSTANGRAFVNMKLTIAELEADQTGERISLVNEYKIKTGLPLFGTRCMPFCYAVEPLETDERQKVIVKRNEEIMEDLINYLLINRSVRAAVGYINQKYQTQFKYSGIMNTLKNEMIYGSYKGNPNYCTPYITAETFAEIQKIISRNPRTSQNEFTYILGGLIKCPECGIRLSGNAHMVKKRGKTYTYLTYRCNNNRLHKFCTFNFCVFENTIERMLFDRVVELAQEKKSRQNEAMAQSFKASKHDLNALQQELDRLNYSWQKGRITNVEKYDREYEAITTKIKEATQEIVVVHDEPDYDKVLNTLSGEWISMYNQLDAEHRKAFWRSFIDNIEITWNKDIKRIDNITFG